MHGSEGQGDHKGPAGLGTQCYCSRDHTTLPSSPPRGTTGVTYFPFDYSFIHSFIHSTNDTWKRIKATGLFIHPSDCVAGALKQSKTCKSKPSTYPLGLGGHPERGHHEGICLEDSPRRCHFVKRHLCFLLAPLLPGPEVDHIAGTAAQLQAGRVMDLQSVLDRLDCTIQQF